VITSTIFIYATRMPRQFLGSTNLQTVAMTSPVQAQARGQVLWDRDHNQWHVAFFNLTPPPAGKEYELWFLRSGNKAPMPSKTFTVDENGQKTLIVEVPPTSDTIVGAAVTIENAGGSTTPTMPIQLVGQLPG
jgi:anti-sigma-K factor RskA